ncbi:hypothetical protein [Desulfuromonas sp. TF]|uniref:hypothetical protein n=1 Tax=Desulfuromonas sp. TF TaxID=1232410 RepID=UPI000488A9D8|nr:hypothetical protein [Desulfuromonas sp. TF]
MMTKQKKPFFPKDKPKSWILYITSGLVGLLVGGPLAYAGGYFEIKYLKIIGTIIFATCWSIMLVMFFVFAFGQASGKYKKMEEKSWKEQEW